MAQNSTPDKSVLARKKIFHKVKNIFILAGIAFLFDMILKFIPSDSARSIAAKIDSFNEEILHSSLRCTPYKLWILYRTNVFEGIYHSFGDYIIGILESFWAWIKNIWNHDNLKPNWLGRIMLLLAIVLSIAETFRWDNQGKKQFKILTSPISLLWNFIKACFIISMLLLILYVLTKLILLLGNGILRITPIAIDFIAAKGFLGYLFRESLSEMVAPIKKKVLKTLNPRPKTKK